MIVYVLHVEHDNAPHSVSLHSTKAKAKHAVAAFARSLRVEGTPSYKALLSFLAEYGEHVRIYKCELDGEPGDEIEVTPEALHPIMAA